ncbi:CDP-diacylglycerol--serine O-phosphatidyltransferase [Bacillus massiliigorillae]|uniref:CDP-diacylglycerol--serine O-phosphatidyltransferase n=1 Tax=Bacillus massiliigorillae TaxID=1243664 RepID=UPI0003A3447B|nr:CDP-diacylglycerol--serine O-phosphatidyltransferase [Bacillus massiliigorillae]
MKRHIPNLFTFGNLFCGFLSLHFTVNGEIANATILIFIAIMLDAVDGRIARILGVSNDLGKQLDSLADVVSFGVAPAYMVALTYFDDWGVWGVALTALFPLCGAFRLARFNLTKTEESMEYFTGIPITMAGGVVTFFILLNHYINPVVFMILFYVLAYLMVSKIKIPSLKDVKLPKNGIITSIFMIYMFILLWRADFKHVPILFYVSLAVYLAFIILRFIKEKEPNPNKRKKKKRKRPAKKK